MDDDYSHLRDHKDLLTQLHDLREEIEMEKWMNLKDDMEDFLQNPGDHELRTQLTQEYEQMVEDAREEIEEREIREGGKDDDEGDSVDGSSKSIPQSNHQKDDGSINSEIEVKEAKKEGVFYSLEDVNVGTVLEAKDMFDNWQAAIVHEKKHDLDPVQIVCDVNGFELTFNDNSEGLSNLAPLWTNLNYKHGTIDALRKKLKQREEKIMKKRQAKQKKAAPVESVIKKKNRKKSTHTSSMDQGKRAQAMETEWHQNDPLEKISEKQLPKEDDFQPLPGQEPKPVLSPKLPDHDPLAKFDKAAAKKSTAEKSETSTKRGKKSSDVRETEEEEPEPVVEKEFVNMHGETGLTVLDLLQASYSNMPMEADTVLLKSRPNNPFPTSSSVNRPSSFDKYSEKTLFYIFYSEQQNPLQQWKWASEELTRRGWKFHQQYNTWFKPTEETNSNGEPIMDFFDEKEWKVSKAQRTVVFPAK